MMCCSSSATPQYWFLISSPRSPVNISSELNMWRPRPSLTQNVPDLNLKISVGLSILLRVEHVETTTISHAKRSRLEFEDFCRFVHPPPLHHDGSKSVSCLGELEN